MPIYAPGKRYRRSQRNLQQVKKDPVAPLSLTPMVDMFTVLVVFLLQNFVVTGTPMEIYKDVNLPSAAQTKPLKPTNVVTINLDKVLFNGEEVMSYDELKSSSSWFILDLNKTVKKAIQKGEQEQKKAINVLKKSLKTVVGSDKKEDEEEETLEHLRLTVQADQDVDFLSIKKAMYTSMEAGILEVNFAVIQKGDKKP